MNAGPVGSGWYYSKLGGPPGQQFGPLSWEQLYSYAQSGVVRGDDLVWNQQLSGWQPAAQIPGLFPAAPPAYGYPAASTYEAGPAYGVGYGPSGYPQAAPRRSPWPWLGPLIAVVLIGLGLGLYFGIWYHKGADEFVQKEGEIFLEPSGVAGPDSFTGEMFVAQGPSTTLSIPNPAITLPKVASTSTTKPVTSTTKAPSSTQSATPPVVAQPAVIGSYSGDTPALYGGSKSRQISDKEGELRFLEQNPLKAAAFCEALNSDPTLRWSGGNQIRPDQLRAYFAELTPVLLTRDTRVTNYGYRNGHPTPRQSILQAGQLILIDRYGVPRKRCECGNPLTPPRASSKPPTYRGPKWPGFNPVTVIVVQQTTVVITIITIIDINTGQPYGRPTGTEGGSDGPPSTTGTTGTTAPPSTETTASTGPPLTGTSETTASTGPPLTGTSETTASTGTPSTGTAGVGSLSAKARAWYGDGNASASDGRNGSQVGNVVYEQGVINQAFGFDGQSFIQVDDGPDLTLGSNDFTIALWVKFNVVQDRDPFISHDESGGSNSKWILWFDRAGHDREQGKPALRFHVNAPGAAPTDAIAAVWEPQAGQWYHVAVSRAQGTFLLYINGDLAATQASDVVIPDPAAPLTIGKAEAFFHNGLIDEVQMWNFALSDGEVRAIYEGALQGKRA
jgi:hypothetical protein